MSAKSRSGTSWGCDEMFVNFSSTTTGSMYSNSAGCRLTRKFNLKLGLGETLESSNTVLKEITERLPDRKVALHAKVALNMPGLRPYKLLADHKAADGRYAVRQIA